jgi:hypothetical protein
MKSIESGWIPPTFHAGLRGNHPPVRADGGPLGAGSRDRRPRLALQRLVTLHLGGGDSLPRSTRWRPRSPQRPHGDRGIHVLGRDPHHASSEEEKRGTPLVLRSRPQMQRASATRQGGFP